MPSLARLQLQTRPDADSVIDRFESWWGRENKTSLLTCGLRPTQELKLQHLVWQPGDHWFDFDTRLQAAEEMFFATPYCCENLPVFWPNLGPDILAAPFGVRIEYAADTSWAHPLGESLDAANAAHPDFQADLWRQTEALQRLSLE
jgi:hypothetical protein